MTQPFWVVSAGVNAPKGLGNLTPPFQRVDVKGKKGRGLIRTFIEEVQK